MGFLVLVAAGMFGALMLGGAILGMALRACLFLVLLPVRLVFFLIGFPLFLVAVILGSLVFSLVVAAGAVVFGLSVAVLALVPVLLPLALVGVVVWALVRSARPASAT